MFIKIFRQKKEKKPKLKIHDVVRTADSEKIFSKEHTNNCLYKLNKIAEIVEDTIPSYLIDKLPECIKTPC